MDPLQLKKKLECELNTLKQYFEKNNSNSIPVLIEGIQMHFNPEILIKEKEAEIENVNLFYEDYLKVSDNIISVSKKIALLKKTSEAEVLFHYKGVPFEFKTDKILIELEEKLLLLKKQHSELYKYLKTGELTY